MSDLGKQLNKDCFEMKSFVFDFDAIKNIAPVDLTASNSYYYYY